MPMYVAEYKRKCQNQVTDVRTPIYFCLISLKISENERYNNNYDYPIETITDG